MKTFGKMLKTEFKLSLRGMDMFIFSICMPLVILVVLGLVLGDKPAYEGADYTFLSQSFGSISTIGICAGGLMGLPLVISDYRNKKILKRFKVTPVSQVTILLVQVSIYVIYSFVSLILIYICSSLFFDFEIKGSIFAFRGGFTLVMFTIFSIGIMGGGIAPNTQTASVIASILYFPMLIFSGATLPYEIMPKVMQDVVNFLPLTQGIKILKAAVLGLEFQNVLLPFIIMVGIMTVCSMISIRYFRWE